MDWDFPTSALDVVTMGLYGRIGWFRRPSRQDRETALSCLDKAGYGLARWWDCSIAGAMALVAGLFFLAAFLFSPGQGLLARLLLHRRQMLRIRSALSGSLDERRIG